MNEQVKERTKRRMSRREFLKAAGAAGVGTVALASLPGLLPRLIPSVRAESGDRLFTAVAITGNTANTNDRFAMQTSGTFDPTEAKVEGSGSFAHFDNSFTGFPKPMLPPGSGLVNIRQFVSYSPLSPPGVFGHIEASILETLADIIPDGGGAVITGVPLRLICNIGALGPAGFTGQPEGYVLTAPFGTFAPLSPIVGLTHISIPGG